MAPGWSFSSVEYMNTFLLFRNMILETFELVKMRLGAETVYLTVSYLIDSLSLSFSVLGVILIS